MITRSFTDLLHGDYQALSVDSPWEYRSKRTGGWSGCESVIGALKEGSGRPVKISWFWVLYWYQSRAGGHYWFRNIRPLKKSKDRKP